MPNCCFNPIHGYWTQTCLRRPYSCVNGSISEGSTKYPQGFETCTAKENHSPSIENVSQNAENFFRNDPRDYNWFGRCKMDRISGNSFTEHLQGSNPCRHGGTIGSLTNRCCICTPEFLKFFLLSPEGSEKRCFYELELDPFEKACLIDAKNVDKKIPFIRPDLDNRVGHWYDSNFDEYGNPISNKAIKCIKHLLMQRPKIGQYLPYENLDKEWLKEFCEFYGKVVGDYP